MKFKERALAILLSLVMVLTFMPVLAFAGSDEEADTFDGVTVVEGEEINSEAAAEELIPAEPERIQADSKNGVHGNVVGISYSPNPITVWGPSITGTNDEGQNEYYLIGRYAWKNADGSISYYDFHAPGDVLKVSYSDGSVISYTCTDVVYDNTIGWFKNGSEYIWPDECYSSSKLVPGNNAITIEYGGCKTQITLFIDTPQLLAQREEAKRQGVRDGSIPKVKISTVKAGKKSITLKWKKLNKKQLKKSKATHYEVWVGVNKAFLRGQTSEHIIKKSKSALKITKVPKGTYFVKVRAIKYVNGIKKVGPWSKTKKVKVKK